jgi:hypothetical protein
MKVNRYLIPVLAVLTLLGSVWVAKAAGVWQTSGRGDILLDEAGEADPAGIRGWMTLTDISETYGVPLDVLHIMIGASVNVPPETALKDLEKLVPGLEVGAVREAVAAYAEGTWSPEEEAPLPAAPEAEIEPVPVMEPNPTGEAIHVPAGPGDGTGAGSGTAPELVLPADGSALPGSEIKGRMTIQEVVDLCQVPLDYLITALGLPADVEPSLQMRDLANQMGIEVVTVREVVGEYQAGQ